MKTTATYLLLFLCVQFNALAQSQELNTKLVLAQDDMRLENFRAATHSLHWLLTNAPDHSKSIYIMAYKAYEKAAEASTDKSEKAILLDSMMLSYQLKDQYFDLTDLERNNFAFRYYKYFRKDKSKHTEALAAYQKVFESTETVINNNIPGYMSIIRSYNSQVRQMDAAELMDIHSSIMKVAAHKKTSGMDAAKLKRYTDVVDKVFYEVIKPVLNCDVIGQIAEGPNNDQVDFAKMIFAWSLDYGCSSMAFFTKAAEIIANDPEGTNPGIMKLLAQKAGAEERFDEAISWYEKTLPLWEDDAKRADTYMDIAKVYVLKEDKPAARKAAFKSAEIDAGHTSGAYSFVANLYMGSFDQCAERYSQVDDRAVFMAAYDLYQKAGDTAGMQNAFAQFPTKSQIHSANYNEGDSIDVGCWINVKTKVRGRPSN